MDMSETALFSKEAARRIAEAVLAYERSGPAITPTSDAVPREIACQFRRFVLDDDHEPGSQTQAHLLRDDGDGADVEDEGTTFDVWDRFEQFRGIEGSRGHAIKYRDTATWEMLSLEQVAQRCRATLKGALDSGDANATVDGVTPLDGLSPVADAAEELTASNLFAWDGDDDAACLIEYDRTNAAWILYQVSCPTG